MVAGLVFVAFAPAMYAVTELPLAPGALYSIWDRQRSRFWINNKGVVLAYLSCGVEGKALPNRTLLIKRGKATELPTFLPSDLNDSGDVAGTEYDKKHGYRPIRFRNGKLTRLSSGKGAASGINNKGEVVGNVQIGDSNYYACIWKNGKARRLSGVPTGSEAFDITDKGDILVGWPSKQGLDAPYYLGYWRNGRKQAFYTGVTFLVRATACNNRLDAVGTRFGVETAEGIIYRNGKAGSQQYCDLTHGLNNAGEIVGGHSYWPNDGGDPPPTEYALIWRSGQKSKLQDMYPSAEWVYESAQGINDRGQIVGYGRHNGKYAAFLLTP